MSRPLALRVARQLRQELLDSGQPWTRQDEMAELYRRCQYLADSALEGLVSWAGERVDTEDTCAATDRQLTFPGFDLDGAYACGDGLRVAKAAARLQHMVAAVEIDDANLRAVQAVNEAKHRELESLRPYWASGMSKLQAIAAYRLANPERGTA